MIFGYARVSREKQILDRQIEILNKYGCDEIFQEKISRKKKDKPELQKLKEKVRAGDKIIIESLSRLGGSTKDLLELIEYFKSKQVTIISSKENIDTDNAAGQLLITVLSALCQFERDVIVERTLEGLAAARARGRKGGRPQLDPKKVNEAIRLYESRKFSLKEIQNMTKISTQTLYRKMKKKQEKKE